LSVGADHRDAALDWVGDSRVWRPAQGAPTLRRRTLDLCRLCAGLPADRAASDPYDKDKNCTDQVDHQSPCPARPAWRRCLHLYRPHGDRKAEGWAENDALVLAGGN